MWGLLLAPGGYELGSLIGFEFCEERSETRMVFIVLAVRGEGSNPLIAVIAVTVALSPLLSRDGGSVGTPGGQIHCGWDLVWHRHRQQDGQTWKTWLQMISKPVLEVSGPRLRGGWRLGGR